MDNEPSPLSAVAILKSLGGTTVVARAISVQRSAVSNWPRAGIPAKYWPAIARLATTIVEAKHITPDVLERHTFGDQAASGATAGLAEAGHVSGDSCAEPAKRGVRHLVTMPGGSVHDDGYTAQQSARRQS